MDSKQYLLHLLSNCFRERYEGHPGQWADRRLRLPYSTQEPEFILSRAPWLIPAFEALGNPQYRKVDIRGPAGSGKSLIGEIDICFCVENQPGTYYYVWPGDEDAKDQVEDRIYPLFLDNAFLAQMLPLDRHKKRNSKIVFPDMQFYSVGANESNAQRVRAFRLTMEEPHMFKSGMLTKFRKRMRGVRGVRELTLSTGSVLGHQTDEEFKSGSCHEFEIPCPHCGHFQALTKDDLEWDKNESTKDEKGEYRWEPLRESMRYECQKCDKPFPKRPEERLELAQAGKAIQKNPNAPKHHFSYHYSAHVVDWIDLRDIGQEYIEAKIAMRFGNLDLYKDFIQKTEANAWDDAPPDSILDVNQRFGAYVKRSSWSDEICRFLTVDNQFGQSSKGELPHRWCLTRAWGLSETRLIDECKVDEWEDVEELRKALGVVPARVLVDIAFDRPDVLKQCHRFGWQGLIGEDRRVSFPHKGKDEKGNPAVFQLPFSPPKHGHVGMGQRGRLSAATYYHWCHKPIKDLYHRLANGHANDYKFLIADDVSDDYKKHVQAEYSRIWNGKREWHTPESRADHLLDCEQMNLSAAVMDPRLPLGKTLKGGLIKQKAQDDDNHSEDGEVD